MVSKWLHFVKRDFFHIMALMGHSVLRSPLFLFGNYHAVTGSAFLLRIRPDLSSLIFLEPLESRDDIRCIDKRRDMTHAFVVVRLMRMMVQGYIPSAICGVEKQSLLHPPLPSILELAPLSLIYNLSTFQNEKWMG